MKYQFYFNITYACNNDCIICASNSGRGKKDAPIIELKKFKEIIHNKNIGSHDFIIINGGEPTVHPSFEKIIEICKKRNVFIYLFTNGKKFDDKKFCENIMKNFRGRIAIPFYSHDAKIHDRITNCAGSFERTIMGVKNLNEIIANTKLDKNQIDLELKTLILRSNMNDLEKLASFLLENFKFDHFLISGPHVSKKAEHTGRGELIKISSCSSEINNCINFFLENSNIQVHCYFIPLCILGNTKYEKICSHSIYKSDRECDFYFDPNNTDGLIWTNDNTYAPICIKCKYYNDCQGVWNSYYDYFGSEELIPIL